MRKLSLLAVALALATGAFWMTMLASPPKSEAAMQMRIDTRDLTLKAHPSEGPPYDAF